MESFARKLRRLSVRKSKSKTVIFQKVHLGREQLVQTCRQILRLDRHLKTLHDEDDKSDHPSSGQGCNYTVQIGISVLENQRNEYVEYASHKAQELINMQCVINTVAPQNNIVWSGAPQAIKVKCWVCSTIL